MDTVNDPISHPSGGPLEAPAPSPGPDGLRLVLVLYFMAVGYALLSVCLFRILCFTWSSTAFFMLYVCFGMPLGALWARRRPEGSLFLPLAMIFFLVLLFPVLGWISTRGPFPVVKGIMGTMSIRDLWFQLIYQTLATSPFFIAWGAAEYAGYTAAIQSGKISRSFYLIFAWGLASALVLGVLSVPRAGWLATLVLAGAMGWAAWVLYRGREKSLVAVLGILVLTAGFFLVRPLEDSYIRRIYPQAAPLGVGNVLDGNFYLQASDPYSPKTARVIKALWTPYNHLSFVGFEGKTAPVFGCSNGVMLWTVFPDGYNSHFFEKAIFDLIPPKADICILGAGGGPQVQLALARDPRSVVAVDIIPEVLDLMKGELAWANGGVYRSPLVRTVGADGRKYIETCGKKFDFILLPYTEYWAAMLRSLFEPSHSLHTLEAFKAMKAALKPDGFLVILKGLDQNGKLYESYARTLVEAGFHVTGMDQPRQEGNEAFALLASPGPRTFRFSPDAVFHFAANGWFRSDFSPDEPPGGRVIRDDSPWTWGIQGLFLPPGPLKISLLAVGFAGLLGVFACLFFGMRARRPGESRLGMLFFLLAGMAVGANAIYLENGVIFWLVRHLTNPLSAFFLGATGFLLLWGLSSLALHRKGLVVLVLLLGLAGVAAFLLSHPGGLFLGMGMMALGTGLLFPLLVLRFPARLIHFFVADALGGLAGGILGIWMPVLSGYGGYYSLLPWIWALTVALSVAALALGRRDERRAVAAS
ncbi:MAG: hypothetical protein ABIJ95_03490 [Pseudomonadota bacterium]